MTWLNSVRSEFKGAVEVILNVIGVNDRDGAAIFDYELDGGVNAVSSITGCKSTADLHKYFKGIMKEIVVVDEKGFDDVLRFYSDPSQFVDLARVWVHKFDATNRKCVVWASASEKLSEKLVLTMELEKVVNGIALNRIEWKSMR